MPTYNSDALVNTMAEQYARDPKLKAEMWAKAIEVISQTADDFSMLEGAPNSDKPVWIRKDLNKDGGDTVNITNFAGLSGGEVLGEQELTGNTSDFELGTYKCRLDYKRDGVELTKKLQKQLATGELLESTLVDALAKKFGRRKQNEMMLTLIREANGNILRPNYRMSRDTITSNDTLSTDLMDSAKAFLQGIGGNPVNMAKSASGSSVYQYLVLAGQDAFRAVRGSTSWQNAVSNAGVRSNTENPIFSGKLVDWNGLYVFEHSIVTNNTTDDYQGSPIQPFGKLGTAIVAGTTTFDILFGSNSTKKKYAQFFPGYDYPFIEDQVATVDSKDYFVWIVNVTGPDAGKAGFYRYTGSSNNGNKITIKNETGNATTGAGGRLGSATSGIRSAKLGNVVWNGATMTEAHPVGSRIIPANANGVPIGYTYVLGKGAAVRCYGSTSYLATEQERDFGFVKGRGYESIFGQATAKDVDGVPRHYALIEHAMEYAGYTVPAVA